MTGCSDSSHAVIERAEVVEDRVRVWWADGHLSRFHFLWLRDNCRCIQCGDRSTGQKLTLLTEIPQDCSPVDVGVSAAGELVVRWSPDDHQSAYESAWLRAHCYSAEGREQRRHQVRPWDAKLQSTLPRTEFDNCVEGENGQLELLRMIRDHGFALVHGVPTTLAGFEHMARRVGHIRETNYGRFSDLKVSDEVRTLSNTRHRIPLHTDECYRHANPGMLAFLCISASEDGQGHTLLADGFNLARKVRDEFPDAFRVLTTVSITSRRYHADEADLRSSSPVISVDYEGRIQGVRFNERSAAPLDVPEEQVDAVYAALRVWQTLAADAANQIRILLEPGDFVVFDNQRVLHGRDSFSGNRHLLYCQLDLDEPHSRALVLAQRFGVPFTDTLMHRGA